MYSQNEVIDFLRESNAIEDVWDADSLSQALFAWEYLSQQKKLSVGIILKTHKILMLHQKLRPDEKGYLRRIPVWIGMREGKPWFALPELMEMWVKKANKTIKEKENLDEYIKEDHVEFERIHPFVDGNGRVGRLLYLWQRVKADLPMHIIFEFDKYKYYEWFDNSRKMW